MKKYLLCFLGFILIMVSFWGGTWFLCELFPKESQYNLAAFFTVVSVCIFGCIILAYGISELG